jgi:hypothetical protein
MAPVLEAKSVGLYQKTVLKGELLIWRTKNQAREMKVQSNSRIQFASNESLNWFLRNWTLDDSPKVGHKSFETCFNVMGHPIDKPCHKRKGLEL